MGINALVQDFEVQIDALQKCLQGLGESLQPTFEKLIRMSPITIEAAPKNMPARAIYLFSEGDEYLYVGRTQKQTLRARLLQHSAPWAQHNQAVFAFKLAREQTPTKGQRVELTQTPEFMKSFQAAKARIRKMDLRYVEVIDPFEQYLLEACVAKSLPTRYNDHDTH
jgi:hypothetical protein